MTIPCPCCDVEKHGPLEGLALGTALGVAFRDMHAITEMCCARHRTPFMLAMLRADVSANTPDTPSEGDERP